VKKEYRIKKSSEIEMIVKYRQSKANKYFVIYKKENRDNTHFRFAVSVSKRFGNAVERNKIKRQVREIISKLDIINIFDVFVVVRKDSKEVSFQDKKESITSLIRKLKILEVKRWKIQQEFNYCCSLLLLYYFLVDVVPQKCIHLQLELKVE